MTVGARKPQNPMETSNIPLGDGEFAEALQKLRSQSSATFDSGFEFLRRHAGAFKSSAALAAEQEQDPRVLAALIEVLGESRDPQFIGPISRYLESDSAEVRFWCLVALKRIGTTSALEIAANHSIYAVSDECAKKSDAK